MLLPHFPILPPVPDPQHDDRLIENEVANDVAVNEPVANLGRCRTAVPFADRSAKSGLPRKLVDALTKGQRYPNGGCGILFGDEVVQSFQISHGLG